MMLNTDAHASVSARNEISRIAKKRFVSSVNRSADHMMTALPRSERMPLAATMYRSTCSCPLSRL